MGWTSYNSRQICFWLLWIENQLRTQVLVLVVFFPLWLISDPQPMCCLSPLELGYSGCPAAPPHQSLHPIHQRHITVPTSVPQQHVFALAEPKRKPSLFWHTFHKLTPFKKWKQGGPRFSCAQSKDSLWTQCWKLLLGMNNREGLGLAFNLQRHSCLLGRGRRWWCFHVHRNPLWPVPRQPRLRTWWHTLKWVLSRGPCQPHWWWVLCAAQVQSAMRKGRMVWRFCISFEGNGSPGIGTILPIAGMGKPHLSSMVLERDLLQMWCPGCHLNLHSCHMVVQSSSCQVPLPYRLERKAGWACCVTRWSTRKSDFSLLTVRLFSRDGGRQRKSYMG